MQIHFLEDILVCMHPAFTFSLTVRHREALREVALLLLPHLVAVWWAGGGLTQIQDAIKETVCHDERLPPASQPGM